MNELSNQKNIYLIPLAIIIVGIVIAGAIIVTGGIKISTGVQLAETSPADLDSQPQPTNSEETGDSGDSGDSGLQPQPTESEGTDQLVVNKEDHIRGNFNAPVTIIEYSDFQCPFCQRFHPTIQQILENYPDQVRWIYKHFPLDSIHSEARPSAEASECAAEQGKFWEFADGLFENQSRLGSNLYKELASQIGLNLSQFEDCVSSRKYKDHVEADLQEGIKAGVTGTPGSFVNGERVSGAVPYSTLDITVKRILAQ